LDILLAEETPKKHQLDGFPASFFVLREVCLFAIITAIPHRLAGHALFSSLLQSSPLPQFAHALASLSDMIPT
jgi:hypothetical protein